LNQSFEANFTLSFSKAEWHYAMMFLQLLKPTLHAVPAENMRPWKSSWRQDTPGFVDWYKSISAGS